MDVHLQKKDDMFIIDVVNDETNIKAELYTWNEGYFENKTAPQNKEFTFNDVTYKGVYNQSIIRKWESYTTNIYSDMNGVKLGFKDNIRIHKFKVSYVGVEYL